MSRSSFRFITGLSLAASTIGLAGVAAAQAPMSDEAIAQLPKGYQTGPIVEDTTETIVGEDGTETIVRTRRIESQYPTEYSSHQGAAPAQYTYAYAPAPTVVEREAWIEECERRIAAYDTDDDGKIIGTLLGALGGGFLGNRIAGDGRRLGGTLIGAGAGGVGGYLIGKAIDGDGKERGYDCAAALDSHLSQYQGAPMRVASRTIAAPTYSAPVYAAPAYGYPAYGYPAYAPNYSYSYAPPPQIVYVPVTYEQPQRVIVRETVREETYQVPGAAREIEQPAPQMIKQPTRVVPAPRPVKMIKQ